MACTLSLTILRLDGPTSAGGWGLVTYRLAGTADSFQSGQLLRVSDGLYVNGVTPGGDGDYMAPIPPVGVGVPLRFVVAEDTNGACQVEVTFTVPGFAQQVDPSLDQPARWEPVGGVLPNSVLLQVEADLRDGTRAGLHVEVELWRPAAVVAFASFRATVRAATQQVDAAPYLRAQLRALQRYAANLPAPLVDADACLRFSYRFRVVDKATTEPWQVRAGERYAVLAALAGPADTMAPYVADGTGKVASVFDNYEATQFVGYPLEVSVLLPPPTGPRWAELRYLDAWGQPVEIRSYALADSLLAGMLRIPLPTDPPVCAASVEVSVRDDNRAFVGSCGHVVPTPPASTSGLYSDPLYGIY